VLRQVNAAVVTNFYHTKNYFQIQASAIAALKTKCHACVAR
jgi:hypothetical protein